MQQAVADRACVAVRYDSPYDQREIETVLEPLRLLFMSRGWYLIARSRMHAEVRTFKLDRLLEVRPTGEMFESDGEFSEREYFGAAWRMIPEGREYAIRLVFSSRVAPNVEEVHWHDSQSTARLDDGRLQFDARVDGLNEIIWWVLGYGDQVEVLAPCELRRRVHEVAGRMRELSAPRNDGGTIDCGR